MMREQENKTNVFTGTNALGININAHFRRKHTRIDTHKYDALAMNYFKHKETHPYL